MLLLLVQLLMHGKPCEIIFSFLWLLVLFTGFLSNLVITNVHRENSFTSSRDTREIFKYLMYFAGKDRPSHLLQFFSSSLSFTFWVILVQFGTFFSSFSLFSLLKLTLCSTYDKEVECTLRSDEHLFKQKIVHIACWTCPNQRLNLVWMCVCFRYHYLSSLNSFKMFENFFLFECQLTNAALATNSFNTSTSTAIAFNLFRPRFNRSAEYTHKPQVREKWRESQQQHRTTTKKMKIFSKKQKVILCQERKSKVKIRQ